MKPNPTSAQEHTDRAIELAHFIHGRKGIALRVVEEAFSSLDLMLGRQDKIRRNYKYPLGFLKWEERSRPMRTTVKLTPAQMLQWLVYEKSEPRERDTEYPDSLYPPGQEDMVVRYIKHLVHLTVKRNSFYVALGIGRLLYDYGTQEVRLMYDVLTQSDTARMKDISYMRKQKMILMDKIRERFGRMLQPVTTAHGEKRFDIQPATDWLINLVNECLRRFTPWETACVVQGRFDPTFIPGLYFSGTNPADEDPFEINRIHTVLDPDCFRHLVNGLSRFAKGLPPDSPDKHCDYDPPDERLAVPQFRHVASGPPRGDRFHPPKLGPEDYLQLQNHRKAQARRRRAYAAGMLRVYVDDAERATFDPRRTNSVQLDVEPEADLIEVRGEDAEGELLLAALMACCDDIPPGGSFRDWIVLEGGQKVTIQLTPVRGATGDIERAQVEVGYAETKPLRAVVWLAQRAWWGLMRMSGWADGRMGAEPPPTRPYAHMPTPVWSWLGRVSVAVVLMAAVGAFIWYHLRPLPGLPTPPRPEIARPPESPAPPVTSPTPPSIPPESPVLMARASWNRDPEAAFRAMRIESARSEGVSVDLSRGQASLLINLPAEDEEGRRYTRYQITLASAAKRLWQHTLRAPVAGASSSAHILEVELYPQQLPKSDSYDLQVEGETQAGWHPLGQVTLRPASR